jgi:transposase
VFRKVWEVLLERYDELHGIAWEWQALDSISGKAPLGGEETGPNPTDRGKLGTKRHLLTDQRGTPLAVAITGANRHDMKTTESTLDGVVVTHPAPSEERLQHLCTDKGYDYPETREAVKARGYVPHIKRRGVESTPTEGEKRYPARRWVVERTLSWLNRFRKLLIRWEKKVGNYLGLVQFACCLIVYRRLKVLG